MNDDVKIIYNASIRWWQFQTTAGKFCYNVADGIQSMTSNSKETCAT